MTSTTTNLELKIGFWRRVWIALQEMEKSPAERQWDALDAVWAENLALKERVAQLEIAVRAD